MNILAIDTATEQLSVALAANAACGGAASAGGGDTAYPADTFLFEANAGLRHSELVLDSIDMLMTKAGLKPEELSGVVCMGGPGSFTGLRIGFSIAKGLALSLGIPLTPIPTLDCMARPFANWPGIIVPAIDAKKDAFFCALYRGGKKLCSDMDAGPAEIADALKANALQAHAPQNGQGQGQEPVLLTGPGAAMLHDALCAMGLDVGAPPEKNLPWGNAKTLLAMAAESGILTSGGANFDCGPEYIRKSDAEIQMKN